MYFANVNRQILSQNIGVMFGRGALPPYRTVAKESSKKGIVHSAVVGNIDPTTQTVWQVFY